MNIPGSNLLGLALGVIAPTPSIQWLAYAGKAKTAIGTVTPSFAAPVEVRGSFQAVDSERMVRLGLDMGKRYAMLYAIGSYGELTRDNASDRFTYDGRVWEIVHKANWSPQDGWDGLLLVDIGPPHA